jgi:uncharacterized protein YndB with AHSA1/START domain
MTTITITTTVDAPLEKVWACWTEPEHIMQWNHASDDWECPKAINDVQEGGTFSATMAAKDGSASFDFEGTYTKVKTLERLEYEMSDGRTGSVTFMQTPKGVTVTETFETEPTHSEDEQREGWQAILNNFKSHVEND